MDQFWQRRLVVDRLVNAPHVDRMRKLMNDMKQVEGQGVPASLPGDGVDSSHYFHLQRQLQRLQPNSLKRIAPTKKIAGPPLPPPEKKEKSKIIPAMWYANLRSPQEVLDHYDKLDKDLEWYRQQAKQEMEQALRTEDEEKIKKADRNWQIVEGNVQTIKEQDEFLNHSDPPFWLNQLIMGKEEEHRKRVQAREDSLRRRNKLYQQLINLYPRQRGKEGYFIDKKFYPRELGWTTWRGDVGVNHYQQPFRWKALTPLDRQTAKYVYHRIHGLPFEEDPRENARSLEDLKGNVLEVYQQSRTLERFLVAYKGGHVEKNLLRELDLPAINLEHFGCPKFEKLDNISIIQDCGQHRVQALGHCAMVECQAFWQWTVTPDEDWETELCL
ncbi:hypothetical protein ACROYT_G007305 [Oculina patagonica]